MLRTTKPTRFESVDDLLDAGLVAQLSRLDLSSNKIFAGKLKGERRSKKRGESVEFADHRPYTLGDDLRHIDWNIYGRLDRLFMKLFLEEEDLSLHLLVDASPSMDCGDPGKVAFAQRAAMALAYIGLVKMNRVAVSAYDARGLTTLRDLRGRRRVHDAGSFLCDLDSETPPGLTFTQACKRLTLARRGKGLIVVLSDFLYKEGYEDGLRMLAGRGYDCVAIQVLSPQELDPERDGSFRGDLRLEDLEDADRAEVTLSAPLLKKYKQTVAAYCDQFRVFCARRDISSLTVSSELPIDSLIVEQLRRRGVLR